MNSLIKEYELELLQLEGEVARQGFTTERQQTTIKLIKEFVAHLKEEQELNSLVTTQVMLLLMALNDRIEKLMATHRKYVTNNAGAEFIMMVNAQMVESKRAYRTVFNNLAILTRIEDEKIKKAKITE